MSLAKCLIFLFRSKERFHQLTLFRHIRTIGLEAVHNLLQGLHRGFFRRQKGSAARDKKLSVFRRCKGVICAAQCFNKTIAQLIQEVQRAAQKRDVPANWTSASQVGNGLVYHGLEHTHSNIGMRSALVKQGLYIRFGKYTTS